jgi:hypothetical protein
MKWVIIELTDALSLFLLLGDAQKFFALISRTIDGVILSL